MQTLAEQTPYKINNYSLATKVARDVVQQVISMEHCKRVVVYHYLTLLAECVCFTTATREQLDRVGENQFQQREDNMRMRQRETAPIKSYDIKC